MSFLLSLFLNASGLAEAAPEPSGPAEVSALFAKCFLRSPCSSLSCASLCCWQGTRGRRRRQALIAAAIFDRTGCCRILILGKSVGIVIQRHRNSSLSRQSLAQGHKHRDGFLLQQGGLLSEDIVAWLR